MDNSGKERNHGNTVYGIYKAATTCGHRIYTDFSFSGSSSVESELQEEV